MGQDEPAQDFAALLEAFEREQGDKSKRRVPQVGDTVAGRIISFGEDAAFVDLGGKTEGLVPLVELRDDDGDLTVALGDSIEALVVATDGGGGAVTLRVHGGRGRALPAELAQAHQHGLPVDGTVQAVVKGGVEVTVAGVRAFCPISQLDARFVEDAAAYVGSKLAFRITRFEEGRGRPNVVLSRRVLLEEEAQAKAAEARARLAVGNVVRGTVTSLTSYGAFVDLGGIEGLLHVSELSHGRIGHPQEMLAVGQEIEVQVREITPAAPGGGSREKPARERISLSRRALLQDPWQSMAARLVVGSRHRGRVARLETFGAFVELAAGVDGLLHISELGAGRALNHPRDAVRVGQELEVAVLGIDAQRRRISLGLASGLADEGEVAAVEGTGNVAEGTGFGALGDFFQRPKKPAER